MTTELEEKIRMGWKDLSIMRPHHAFLYGKEEASKIFEKGKEIEKYFTNNPNLIERCLGLLDSEERINMVSFEIEIPLKKYKKEYEREFDFLVEIKKRPNKIYELSINKLGSLYAKATVTKVE